ncbi:MAG: type IV pilus assembly protein PilM [bacterium]|nr:type IV pilus assembly protein PilM [bacterium]
MVNPFKMFFPKKMLGIDIGVSSIKLVELSRFGDGKTLENYGQLESEFISPEPLINSKKGGNLLASDTIAHAIKGILEEAKIRTKPVIFSIPDFFTFCTSFEIPQMPQKEIEGAIKYNASQYIPLPISEVTLDWKIVASPQKGEKGLVKVFLVAVPNQVVEEYQKIAAMCGLEIYALEAEALGMVKSLVKNNKKTICLMDIGVQSSTVNIIDNGNLQRSYSFNFHSGQLANAVSSALNVGQHEAEEIKNKEGILSSRQGVAKALYLLVDSLLREIKLISSEFYQSEQKQVEEIYLTGGTANLPGLKEYISESLKKYVAVPNSFAGLLYPPILEETLRQMSPGFSVAVGAALGGLEN